MDPVLSIREYLEYVVARLFTHHEACGISHKAKDGRHFFSICLNQDDAGRVIGRNGRTINAIRSLALASAEKHGLRVSVVLDDPLAEVRRGND